jgi:hypothetical protein
VAVVRSREDMTRRGGVISNDPAFFGDLADGENPFNLSLPKGGTLSRLCFDKPVLRGPFVLRQARDDR